MSTGAATPAARPRVEIQVSVPPLLRDSVRLPDPLTIRAATLREALATLLDQYPLLRVHLYEERGRLRPHVLIYHNTENIAWLESLDVPLSTGDQLQVLQAVSGG